MLCLVIITESMKLIPHLVTLNRLTLPHNSNHPIMIFTLSMEGYKLSIGLQFDDMTIR